MRSYSSYANSDATMVVQSKSPSTPTVSASEEESLIVRVLHAETKDDFRNAIDSLIDPDEWGRLQKAEENGLLLQSAAMLDQIVRQRLPRRLRTGGVEDTGRLSGGSRTGQRSGTQVACRDSTALRQSWT